MNFFRKYKIWIIAIVVIIVIYWIWTKLFPANPGDNTIGSAANTAATSAILGSFFPF